MPMATTVGVCRVIGVSGAGNTIIIIIINFNIINIAITVAINHIIICGM